MSNIRKALIRTLAAGIVAMAATPVVTAQDFLGGLGPQNGKKQETTQQTQTKKKAKTARKVNLPDKPNKTDVKGLKQGEWAKKYPNGQYMYTANFKNGKPIGKVTRYDEYGHKTAELTYKTQSDTVKVVFYHNNGKVQARGQYVNDLREGLWRTYNEEGVLVETASYSKNKLHGKRCYYFSNGALWSVCTWADSLRNGSFIRYFPSGAKEIEATFHGDVLDGQYKSWGSDGKLSSEGTYRMGVTVGKWHLRYADANVEGDIIYDSRGQITNTDEADSLFMKRDQYYQKNVGKFKDPEDYMNNPEEFLAN